MPTKPFEPLLYRDLRKVEAKKVIEIASPLLQELVNHATNAFQRCQVETAKGVADEHLPVLSSYYHTIEMADGIEVLISQSCTIPAILLLRSSFEAILTIDYILEKDYRKRAFAWLVCYVRDRLHKYKMLDISTQEGKEFQIVFNNDLVREQIELPPLPKLGNNIRNLESLLEKPDYQFADIEYKRMKKIIHGKPNWYSLYDGPRSFQKLAAHLKRGAIYEMLYRHWASISHASDLSHFLAKKNNGTPALNPIRNHEELIMVTGLACTFILEATRLALSKFRPGEMNSLRRWYITEVSKPYLLFQKNK
jgi:hypothetical protein